MLKKSYSFCTLLTMSATIRILPNILGFHVASFLSEIQLCNFRKVSHVTHDYLGIASGDLSLRYDRNTEQGAQNIIFNLGYHEHFGRGGYTFLKLIALHHALGKIETLFRGHRRNDKRRVKIIDYYDRSVFASPRVRLNLAMKMIVEWKQITRFDVCECTFVTDEIIISLATNSPELIHFNARLTNITDVALCAIAENCKKLSFLDVAGTYVTDTSLVNIAENCKMLILLKIAKC